MRDARFVGLAADGQALIVEHAGEHVRVVIDDAVRAAVRGQAQPQMRLESGISPREVQHRIRCGQSAEQIATDAGVAVEQIARYEGPVLAERAWHVEQARATEVDGTTLDDRVADVNRDAAAPVWDAWLDEDGSWQVAAVVHDGRRAVWSWNPRTRRLRPRDDLARFVLSGDVAANDLEAVLRPLASARRLQPAPERSPSEPATPEPAAPDTGAPEPVATADDGADPSGDDGGAQDPTVRPVDPSAARDLRRRRRQSVPSWDEIVFGASRPRAEE